MTRRKKIVHYYFIYPLAITISLLSLSLGLASFFLLNIQNYQTTIKNMLSNSTGYNVNVSGIHGSFNLRFQPTVNIDNIDISDKANHRSFVHINNLKLAASYRSFSLGKIVLSQIDLDGMNLTLNYDKDNNVILNGQIVSNSKTKSSFDLEKFLLDLHKFDISNLNLTFINQMYDLNPIRFVNTEFNFENSFGNRHSLLIKSVIGRSSFNSKLTFQGETISEITNWKSGDLIISDKDSSNHNIDLKATLSSGNLEFLNFKFNSNMRQFFASNSPVKGKGDLLGEIQVRKNSSGIYKIVGNDLTINTINGPILNHASLGGSYTLDKGGYVNLSRIDLDGISSLKVYQFSDRVTLDGYFESLHFSWNGNLLHPNNILLNSRFKDISVTSSESTIPSINNINGTVEISKDSGFAKFSLANSQFKYPLQFDKPILITKLDSKLNWVIESNFGVIFNWQNSNIQTKSFSLITSGKYYLKNNILDTNAKIDKFRIVDTIDYIPLYKAPVANFIKSSMPKGVLTNLNLSINGEINKIPFDNGGGELRYSESFSDVTLKFANSWGAVTHINGTLSAINQKVKVNIDFAKLNSFNVSNTSYTVANFIDDNPIVNLSGFGSGKTTDFIDYLKTTPLKSKFQYEPKMLRGKSEVTIKLDLPIVTPKKLKLFGKWNFINNDIDFGDKVPYIENLNGPLNFTNNGVSKSILNAKALGSNLEFTILDSEHYKIISSDLDYGAFINFFGFHNDIISGRAITILDYYPSNSSVSINSNLQGVKIKAPEPLGKNESDIKELSLNFNQNHLSLNYDDVLFALLKLNGDMKFDSIKIGLGTPELNIKYNNNFPITINTKLKNLYTMQWVDFFKELSSFRSGGSSGLTYPTQVQLYTDALWVNNYNIDGGRVDLSINKNKVISQINMPDIYGDLIYQNNKLWLNLDKLILSNSNLTTKNRKKAISEVQSKSSLPDVFIKIKNLYLQNHFVGELSAKMLERNKIIYIENASLDNFASKTTFRIIDHAVTESKEYTALRLRSQIKDYGRTISKLNIGDNIKGGDGVLDLGLKWRGGILDYGIKKTLGYANLNIKHGEFTRINPGIFGTLVGVVSLNSITNIGNLNLNTFFGKGFAFDSWDMKVDIIFDQLRVENLKLVSNSASISSFGTVNLKDDTVDSYLTVEPRLGTAVATTAGIVTLNPIIGGLVYVGEALIGNPVNKALGLSYHITGKVTNPVIKNFDLSEQLQKNFISSTNIISHPSSIFDVEVNK